MCWPDARAALTADRICLPSLPPMQLTAFLRRSCRTEQMNLNRLSRLNLRSCLSLRNRRSGLWSCLSLRRFPGHLLRYHPYRRRFPYCPYRRRCCRDP